VIGTATTVVDAGPTSGAPAGVLRLTEAKDPHTSFRLPTRSIAEPIPPRSLGRHQLRPKGSWALTSAGQGSDRLDLPTAYHINVEVRDGSACWPSNGNWNNSNQPDIDPFTRPADADTARHRDRDWHVVIEQPQLATMFQDYLLNDLTVRGRAQNRRRNTRPAAHPAAAGRHTDTGVRPVLPGQRRSPRNDDPATVDSSRRTGGFK